MIERRERRRRDGTTYTVWRARWRDETGAERRKTFDRAADARVWEAKVRTMKRAGALAELDAGTETLAEFVEEWWLVYAGPNLERATLRTYAQLWNGHALSRLGHLQLRQLTPQTIARFRAELEGAGVGNEAIRKTMTMLQGVLQRAVEWGRVSVERGEDHAQAAEAVPAGGAGDPAVGDRGHARAAARRRQAARREPARRARLRRAAAAGGARARVAPRSRAHAAGRARGLATGS